VITTGGAAAHRTRRGGVYRWCLRGGGGIGAGAEGEGGGRGGQRLGEVTSLDASQRGGGMGWGK
jgi:hypothetical protein